MKNSNSSAQTAGASNIKRENLRESKSETVSLHLHNRKDYLLLVLLIFDVDKENVSYCNIAGHKVPTAIQKKKKTDLSDLSPVGDRTSAGHPGVHIGGKMSSGVRKLQQG